MNRRVTCIIGLGSEIGLAIARAALERGHSVALCGHDSKRVASAREGLPDDHVIVQQEEKLHDSIGLRNCLVATREAFGRVDSVIYVPRLPSADTLDTLDEAGLDADIKGTCLASTVLLSLFSEQMRTQEMLDLPALQRRPPRGAFTFVLSLAAQLADPARFSETVTQQAVLGVMRAGAVSLAPDRISVNALVALRPRAERIEPWLVQRTPLGRAALADEVAAAALYLSSSEAGFVTGQSLTLDGGRSVLNGIVPDPE